jgi:hypothetical protein
MIYTDIVNTALGFADRQDTEVANMVPMMITNIIETNVNRYLSIKKSSGRATTPGQGTAPPIYYYDLPTDFMELRGIKIWTSNTDPTIPASILYVPSMCNPEQMDWAVNNNNPNIYLYSIEGTQFRIWPAINAPAYIEILYYRMVPPINSSSPSNWLSLYYPDVYLFGLIAEINAFCKDAEAFSLWNKRFINSLDAIQAQDDTSTWSGPALQTKLG